MGETKQKKLKQEIGIEFDKTIPIKFSYVNASLKEHN